MRLKSFHGPNIADAMRQVRDALGDDAVIVATRDDEMGGVRVTAALDDTPPPNIMLPPPQTEDVIEPITDALYRHGVHAALAEKLIATAFNFAEEDAVIALAAGFDAHVKFAAMPDVPPRPLLLAGPPGAGKTLAVAKLATAAKMRKQPVTVITTDMARAGGVQQLAAFTTLLKVKLLEIDEPDAMADMLSELAGSGTVLVDSAGINPFDEREKKEFAHMTASARCDIALVLPCALDSADGADLTVAFRALGADRLILTRADMARRMGSMLNISYESGMPLAAISRSPQVAEPLAPLNPVAVARILLGREAQAGQIHPQQTGTHF